VQITRSKVAALLRTSLLLLLLGLAAALFLFYRRVGALAATAEYSVEQRLTLHGPAVAARLTPLFQTAGINYPPARLTLIGLKHEKQLEVWAANSATAPSRHIVTYPIVAASGGPGPKLREGDCQVPEGIYGIESLNPNSLFHLSLRIDYPNAADRAQAKTEGRTNLGGDIMIHGSNVSIGCLAMGDQAAEDLFILAALTGRKNIQVILTPIDFRTRDLPPESDTPPDWVQTRYKTIKQTLTRYPKN
jgi:murein L,D-transpeptidase YafK